MPKSTVRTSHPDWHACVARDFLERPPSGGHRLAAPASIAGQHGACVRDGLGVSLMLFTGSMVYRSRGGPSHSARMQRAGEEFVIAFARPLIDPSSGVPPIQARLRFIRRAGQLEISIAPGAGRRYPNLVDHKTERRVRRQSRDADPRNPRGRQRSPACRGQRGWSCRFVWPI